MRNNQSCWMGLGKLYEKSCHNRKSRLSNRKYRR
nr:MAG TPA: hypothetical protein [Caudoviricetes sp.]